MTEKEIFLAAIEISDVAERAAYLSRACGPDSRLREKVESLLRAHDRLPPLAEGPTGASPPSAASATPTRPVEEEGTGESKAAPDRSGAFDQLMAEIEDGPGAGLGGARLERPGSRIGPYHLLQQLGEGGMGVVYLAEQEQPVRRRVALKLIKAGFDSAQVLARFEQERQALALMDHPNIARVLDAGATESGRPYFVMELVKGVPLTRYCDEARLTLRERLELFIPVCEAVQHAHTKGIIHRDLKPSNVLVGLFDGRAIPKVIDFGVAKATTGPLTERTLFTEVGSVIGTPEYMSPEQAEINNLDVDTRSDVYSLGVILYELLTGSPPFSAEELRGAAFIEMLRMIRETEPPRPSNRLATSGSLPSLAALRRLEPERLTRGVSGELDWIVMKCLEKEQSRRYETAKEVALDLLRHLADEPVRAGPPSKTYRLRKAIRRHRIALATTIAFVVLLVGAAVGGTVLALRARSAEKQAKAHGETAEQNFQLAQKAVKSYVEALSRSSELSKGDLMPLRKQLLETAIPFFEELSRRAPGNVAQEVERGHALLGLTAVRVRIGEPELGLRNAEEAERIAAKLLEAHPARDDVEALFGDALAKQGWALEYLGRLADAAEAHRRALASHLKVSGRHPEDLRLLEDVATDQYNLGVAAQNRADLDGAEALFDAAEGPFQKLAEAKPQQLHYLRAVVSCRRSRGQVFASRGRLKDAEEQARRASALGAEMAGRFPGEVDVESMQATLHADLGEIYQQMSRHAEAEKEYLELVGAWERLHRRFPTRTSYWTAYADALLALGSLYIETGRATEADTKLLQSIAENEALEKQVPQYSWARFSGAEGRRLRARLLVDRGLAAEAEPVARDAASRLERECHDPSATHETFAAHAAALSLLGEALRMQGKREEAIAASRRAVETIGAQVAAHPEMRELAIGQVAALHRFVLALTPPPAEAREELERACRQAEEEAEKLGGEGSADRKARRQLADCLAAAGAVRVHRQDWDAARSRFERSAGLREALARELPALPAVAIELANSYRLLGELARRRGEAGAAVEWHQKAVQVLAPRLANEPGDAGAHRLSRIPGKTWASSSSRLAALPSPRAPGVRQRVSPAPIGH